MWTPGLIDCGSTIQPPRLPRVLGSVPAARVLRDAMCVRFGPTVPYASTPVMAWQDEQAAERKTFLPSFALESLGSAAGDRARESHAAKSARLCTTTGSAINACSAPQNSAHCAR